MKRLYLIAGANGSGKSTLAKEFFKRMDDLFNQGASIAIETTLAGKNHIKTIQRAVKLGYEVSIIYIFVESVDICINRIQMRVMNGGHSIPESDVIRRYHRSKHNFWNIYKHLADEWVVYYNGNQQVLLIANGSKEEFNILDEAVFKILLGELNDSNTI